MLNRKKEDLFDAIDGKIKKGGLKRQLRVKPDYKFTKQAVNRLARIEVGKRFNFEGNDFRMTSLMRKRVLLAKNMMK